MIARRSFAQHLDPVLAPKRILALDGGGLRGVLTLGMLREIEATLRARAGGDPSFRLSDYFDLIAGTSTGAIIAAALSLGMSVDEVHGHYLALGSKVFKRSLLRWGALRAKYDADGVRRALTGIFGERPLSSPDFRTGLLVMTKRLDTGIAWPITNHPGSRYFRAGTRPTTIPNGEFPLWQVVRASTAAPYFFDSESIRIGKATGGNAVSGEFVDGGVSPSNNPSLQALMTSTIKGYGFDWSAGQDQILVVSVGTGKADAGLGHGNVIESTAAIQAVLALKALMDDCADQVEAVMQWLSVSPTARIIDRELGRCEPPLGGRALTSYLRYNVLLWPEWVAEHLGEAMDASSLKKLEAMDEPDNIPELDRIGRLAGARLVKAEHFPSGFDG